MTTLARVTLAAANGVPADVVVNTFHFGQPGDGPIADPTGHATSLVAFYNVDHPTSVGPIARYLCPSMSRGGNANRIDFYDLDAPDDTPPYATAFWTLGASAGDGLPGEVAACVTWTAAVPQGGHAARYRGRTFLGRLNGLATEIDAGHVIRLSAGFFDAIRDAGFALIDERDDFVVFSKKDPLKKPPQANDEAHLITGGWIDNAFDTIRSRGQDPNVRTYF